MAFGEVFAALETKAIDGQENPFVTIDTSKFYEVQKYLTLTRHAYTPMMVLYSKPLWDSCLRTSRRRLTECAIDGRDRAAQGQSRALSRKSLRTSRQPAWRSNELTPADQTAMREAVKPVYEKHAATIGQEVVDDMKAELTKLRDVIPRSTDLRAAVFAAARIPAAPPDQVAPP